MTSYTIGLISGTSMDGIDAAIIDEKGTLIHGLTHAYSEELAWRLSAIMGKNNIRLDELLQLNRLVGEAFSDAAQLLIDASQIPFNQIQGIGSHGQTIIHNTKARPSYTLQLGCAHTIAERTGLPTIADFRTRDLILGGEGAPFAPWYHAKVFRDLQKPLAIVNIGGISNLTILTEEQVSGYDIGPGNCLLDAWIFRHQYLKYDKDGQWACSGENIERLLSSLLADPFFSLSAPKSIGKEYFSLSWLDSFLIGHEKPADVQRTLLNLTAQTIVNAIRECGRQPLYLLICGGGVHNQMLMMHLKAQLSHMIVSSTKDFGVHPDFLEAMMFAALAREYIEGRKIDMRWITGSTKPAMLGAFYTP